jgi:hypothetical protein
MRPNLNSASALRDMIGSEPATLILARWRRRSDVSLTSSQGQDQSQDQSQDQGQDQGQDAASARLSVLTASRNAHFIAVADLFFGSTSYNVEVSLGVVYA